MSKQVLVIKKAGGLQTLQTVGAGAKPKLMDTMRAAFGRGTKPLNRAGALLGLGLKGAAATGAVVNTAKRMQSGDITAPLQAGQDYESLDASSLVSGNVQEGLNNQQKFQSQQNQIPQSTPTQRMSGYTTGSNPNQVGVRAKGPARYNVPKPGDSKPAKPEWMNKPKGPTNVRVLQPGEVQPPNPFVNNPTSPNVGGQTRGSAPVNRAVPPGMPGTVDTVGRAFEGAIAPAHPQTTSHPMAVQQQTVQPLTPPAPTPQAPTPQAPTPQAPTPQAPMQPPMTPPAMAAQPAQPAQPSPMDLAMGQMPTYQQGATAPTSTANPLSKPNMNNANEVLGSFYNTLSPDQQAHGGAVQGAIAAQGNFNTDPYKKPDMNQGVGESLGNTVNWPNPNQGSVNMADPSLFNNMLKAYVKKLYEEFGGYLYKMTPHEAGQFAVYTLFTLRK
tara:strand:- start:8083 stop:9408 length:1326 start_codon:yes stop_codon:yes gene_type:complete